MHDLLGAHKDTDVIRTHQAKAWCRRNRHRIYEVICIEFDYCEKKKKYEMANLVELIAALSALLAGPVGHAAAAGIVATIAASRGLDSFCKCDAAGYLIDKASFHLDEQRHLAKDLVLQALEHSPLYPGAHYLLALPYDTLGDAPLAVRHCRDAIELDPDDWYALNNLGYILTNLRQDLGLAKVVLERTIKLAPDNDTVNHSYGLVLLRTEHYSDTIPYLQNAAESDARPARIEHLEEAKRLSGSNE
jgi:tetratricopeptide (TPR) repeat protein